MIIYWYNFFGPLFQDFLDPPLLSEQYLSYFWKEEIMPVHKNGYHRFSLQINSLTFPQVNAWKSCSLCSNGIDVLCVLFPTWKGQKKANTENKTKTKCIPCSTKILQVLIVFADWPRFAKTSSRRKKNTCKIKSLYRSYLNSFFFKWRRLLLHYINTYYTFQIINNIYNTIQSIYCYNVIIIHYHITLVYNVRNFSHANNKHAYCTHKTKLHKPLHNIAAAVTQKISWS